MSDNFDLQKFLKENKSLENLNPIMKGLNDKETKKTLTESVDGKTTKSSLRDQIREIVLAEMEGEDLNESPEYYLSTIEANDMDEDTAYEYLEEQGLDIMTIENIISQAFPDLTDDEDFINPGNTSQQSKNREEYLNKFGMPPHMREELNLDEAKEDEEEIDAEEINAEVTDEEEPTSDVEIAAAGATGDSKELINHLMSSLEVAKAMGNEKLTTQVMNTLKFAIDQSMAS